VKIVVEFLFNIGQEVTVTPIEMIGRVDALMMDTDGLQYRVVYWNDGQRYSQWVYSWELK
jgi:hypothetical protein